MKTFTTTLEEELYNDLTAICNKLFDTEQTQEVNTYLAKISDARKLAKDAKEKYDFGND